MAIVWKGSLSLPNGLISIPVAASVAGRPKSIRFNRLHSCGKPVKQRYYCNDCKEHTSLEKCSRGHQVVKNRVYIPVTEEELKKCRPRSEQVMEIEKFVSAHEIDPVLCESTCFLEPEPSGKKGYALLHGLLAAENAIAIAKVTMHSREHVVIIRPYRDCLAFHKMFYQDEIRAIPQTGLHEVQINPKELELARELLQANKSPFVHGDYADGYLQAVEGLLAKKRASMPAIENAKQPRGPTVDLIDGLLASIEAAKKKAAPKSGLALVVPTRKKRQRKQAIAAEVKAS